ncbi:glucosaminidase domain-containing protein [Flavobacterium sp.]|uniref:glucosaminidase domain-containing protein n=1 Tax=Flavobacterium sp. TaxID=239 RepID=UPI00286EA9D7|nr:glucosaminidase domain-containing protein [Flavobacterium sp.]
MYKISVFFLAFFIVSCSASKPNKRASKKTVVKEVVKPVQKIVAVVSTEPVAIEIKTVNEQPKIEVLEATQKIRVTQAMVLEYILNFKQIAQDNMTAKGIPASITIAQGILESGAGTGDLALQANNHFGIKCHKEWMGASVRHDDDAPQECFRKYDKPEQSYLDHSDFLTSRPWYAPLFKLEKNDYKGWAKGLKKAGYATDVKYPQKLIGLIEKYQLQQYDAEVLGIEYVVVPKMEVIKIEPNTTENNSEKYWVAKGDTLYSISKKFNITVEDLKKKNNLLENTLSLGQSLHIK